MKKNGEGRSRAPAFGFWLVDVAGQAHGGTAVRFTNNDVQIGLIFWKWTTGYGLSSYKLRSDFVKE
jgi:hypothetical protein